MKADTILDLLQEAKDYSSIALDLSFYSLIWNDKRAALEVSNVEKIIDKMWRRLLYKIMLAARSPSQARDMVSLGNLGVAFDRISNAAGDIAGIVLQGLSVSQAVKNSLLRGEETVALVKTVKAPKESISISEIEENVSRIDVLLVKRDREYILAPDPSFKVKVGDLLIVRGTLDEIEDLARFLGDEDTVDLVTRIEESEEADPLADLVLETYNLASLMMDLAFHSVFNLDKTAAVEIVNMEEDLDQMYVDLLATSYKEYRDKPEYGPAIAILAKSLESLGDAAKLLAMTVLEGSVHFIVEEAGEESRETVIRVQYTNGEKPLEELSLSDMGGLVLAVYRSRKWIPLPPETFLLKEGDELLVKFYILTDEAEDKIYKELRSKSLIPLED
ncbi:MAG: hypothetical protein GSR82_03140 [Desulfurococcales archaeon]|nr:hypothetical protein [Desulfurococcales archaeon]MEB3758954.1 hypothetical protein [Desulfurococcales archaeon]MEB3772659.1 hypothetical protein [Desulfurococcales archaeon]MEB3786825.1 hypothetical protein [Desulfurococcales archaeon]MEB3799232.1 hypothetical protein [Desulfurococcales archaeon]